MEREVMGLISRQKAFLEKENLFHCYLKVKEVVKAKWNTKDKEYANHILDLFFLSRDKGKMKFDFQNKISYAQSPIGFDTNFLS